MRLALGLCGVVVAFICSLPLAVSVLAAAEPAQTATATGPPLADIPAAYLLAYRTAAGRYGLGADGWSYLAAIGKVESDHGRSRAPGVLSGQNSNGCCAGPMQIDNAGGTGGGTWGAHRQDGDGDGRFDIYDVDDAVATAAVYLERSGAPGDWPRAIFAYNHADWYVTEVLRQAAAYRRAALTAQPSIAGAVSRTSWLAPVPGFPGQRCDRRIVPDVVAITRAYGLRLTACFGGAPHALGGEHPLGLAADVVPVDGNWNRTERLARAAGWRPSCAAAGCPGRGPFRVVLYNGYPGHGDPRFSRTPHLHLSWQHGAARPFTPAPWVRTVIPSTAAGVTP
jgi:hypothetical protein